MFARSDDLFFAFVGFVVVAVVVLPYEHWLVGVSNVRETSSIFRVFCLKVELWRVILGHF